MKKFIAMLLVLVMAVGLLAGCGNKALVDTTFDVPSDGTYEAIGKHFNGNPYGLCDDILELHGVKKVDVIRDFDHIKEYLTQNNVEGLVFWLNGEPVCKIKRSDFGLPWPMKG